jgi:hypothetical protein
VAGSKALVYLLVPSAHEGDSLCSLDIPISSSSQGGEENITRTILLKNIFENISSLFPSLNVAQNVNDDEDCMNAEEAVNVEILLHGRRFEEAIAQLVLAVQKCAHYQHREVGFHGDREVWLKPDEHPRKPNVLHSMKIEGLLRKIARRALLPLPPLYYHPPQTVRRILHVATELYPIGGHTKALYSFIHNNLSERDHTVYMTTPLESMSFSEIQALL